MEIPVTATLVAALFLLWVFLEDPTSWGVTDEPESYKGCFPCSFHA